MCTFCNGGIFLFVFDLDRSFSKNEKNPHRPRHAVLSGSAIAQIKDIEAIKKLNEQWIASYVPRDTATLNRIFADDIELTNLSGKLMHKSEMLKALVSPDQEYISTKVDTASVRLFDNISIINAKVTGVVKAEGKTHCSRQAADELLYTKLSGDTSFYTNALHELNFIVLLIIMVPSASA